MESAEVLKPSAAASVNWGVGSGVETTIGPLTGRSSQRKNLVHDLGQDHGQDQGGMDYCGQIPQHLAPRSWP